MSPRKSFKEEIAQVRIEATKKGSVKFSPLQSFAFTEFERFDLDEGKSPTKRKLSASAHRNSAKSAKSESEKSLKSFKSEVQVRARKSDGALIGKKYFPTLKDQR